MQTEERQQREVRLRRRLLSLPLRARMLVEPLVVFLLYGGSVRSTESDPVCKPQGDLGGVHAVADRYCPVCAVH